MCPDTFSSEWVASLATETRSEGNFFWSIKFAPRAACSGENRHALKEKETCQRCSSRNAANEAIAVPSTPKLAVLNALNGDNPAIRSGSVKFAGGGVLGLIELAPGPSPLPLAP